MSHHHFTPIERGKIEELNKLGYSSREIAIRLKCHRSSISRELCRFANSSEYNAETAQLNYEMQRKNSRPNGKWNDELAEVITDKLKATWSPEQIAHTVTKGKVSFKTIYNWIYVGRLKGITSNTLRRKGKKKTSQTAKHFARGTPIQKRPKEVYSRKTFGHWELDTVVPRRGENSICFATFIERKTRLYTAMLIQDRTAVSMESAIKYLYSILPNKAFLTATTDRGGEFACFDNIKKHLGLTLYFADPYCPHQRGSNEYGNGLLREFFPKNSSFDSVSQEFLSQSLFLINSRPRKCLGWISPIQAFLHELAHLT
jgi:IS30 family transposase